MNNPVHMSTIEVAQTCENLIRPIVQLALDGGLSYDDLDSIMRSVLAQEGQFSAGWIDQWYWRRESLARKQAAA
jgi:hypothetical protein